MSNDEVAVRYHLLDGDVFIAVDSVREVFSNFPDVVAALDGLELKARREW